MKLKATKKTKVTIQDTVKVGNYSFKVTTIGKNAFKNNKKLTQVIIGKNVSKIGANAFNGAKKLEKDHDQIHTAEESRTQGLQRY